MPQTAVASVGSWSCSTTKSQTVMTNSKLWWLLPCTSTSSDSQSDPSAWKTKIEDTNWRHFQIWAKAHWQKNITNNLNVAVAKNLKTTKRCIFKYTQLLLLSVGPIVRQLPSIGHRLRRICRAQRLVRPLHLEDTRAVQQNQWKRFFEINRPIDGLSVLCVRMCVLYCL